MDYSVGSLDILAIGAHPDDVEIGMGGTLAKYARQGYKIGICSLTKAELSSNGTVEIRQKEAEQAAETIGAATRIQLDFPDRGLSGVEEQINEVVSLIRKYKPRLVFAPYPVDRHPDHGRCSSIVKEAVFSSAIKKYSDKDKLFHHRVESLYYYMINGFHKPDFVIDISETIMIKIRALSAYQSQFTKSEGSVDTPLTNDYLETVESRERVIGKEVGVTYGEGFMSDKPILLEQLLGEKK